VATLVPVSRKAQQALLALALSSAVVAQARSTAADEPPSDPQESSSPNSTDELAEDDDDGISAQAVSGWIIFGLGGASFIAGTITGIMALDRHNLLSQVCPNRQCAQDYHADVDLFDTLRTTSTATIIAAGVAMVGGVTLLLTVPSNEEAEPEPEPAEAEQGSATGSARPASSWLGARLGLGTIILEGAF
jgi:hypothetical protein